MAELKEYMIVLNPSKVVEEHIKLYKHGASEFIGTYPGLNSKAHISLWHKQKLSRELIDTFTTIVQRKFNNIPSTNVAIDGFNYFAHGTDLMTIYANIKSNYITDNWFDLIRKQLNLNNHDFVPHITVTRSIPVDAFYTLWPKFKATAFQINFVPASISVLERDLMTPDSTWQLHKKLFFKGMEN